MLKVEHNQRTFILPPPLALTQTKLCVPSFNTETPLIATATLAQHRSYLDVH